MDSANVDRRPRKIRRTGRHTAPSGVEKVAEKAGKAAPAVAIAGALVAMPQANAAVKAPAKATLVAGQTRADAAAAQAHTVALVRSAQPAARRYTVRSGNTLSSIARRFYGSASRWTWIYAANRSVIRDPDVIYVGQSLTIPSSRPSGAASYTPRHAKTAARVLSSSTTRLSGNLSCSGLEALWESAGGSRSAAFMAAEIAMAESGGRQYAHSPTNDFGYWQINGTHGPSMATYNPYGNARAAVIISGNGTNWTPWTTYVTGAYRGRC